MAKTPPDKSKDDGSARPPKTSKTGAREPAAMGQSVPTPKRSPSSKTPLANNVKRTLRTKADTAPATGIEKADRSQKKVRDLASGGGDRVAAGVNFHASICAALAVWMLTGRSVDHRLELGDAQIVTLRAESESPLDDVLAQTSAGGVIAVQAKSSLSFGKELSSEFGKTIEQIVRQWRLCRNGKGDLGWNRPLDAATDRLVIAVGPESPATMRVDLKEGLDARRQPGPPVLTKATKAALDKFDACVRLAWESMEPSEALTEDRLLAISRLTHVYVSDPQGLERAALETVLGTALAAPADATSALEVLEKRSEHLMEKRGGWDLAKLRADLLTRGVKLAARPDYRSDIAALKECSMRTAEALLEFEVVTPEVGVSVGIKRECQDAVDAAALEGDLLLIGEPGAGKSAMLNSLGRTLRERGHDVVQLAVDRYPIASLEGLSHALQLQHDLLAVLEQWDGAGPAFLLIDALDASRGGSAESVFKSVVEGVVKRHGRWTVVASIRTFDLRMGQSFPALFEGTPPVDELKGVGLPRVRHVQIPAWSPTEFAQLLAKSPRLAEVLSDAPWKLRELAMVPFNLRLLAELIANGAVSESFQQVKSQIELLNLYWKWRVEPFGTPGQICLKAVLAEMIIRRAIYARRLAVAAPDAAILDNLEKQGVLIAKDRDTIRFRHHLLFDYAASRVFLDADAIIAGDTVFRKSEGAGLILAPAVSFLLQDLWSEHPQRARFWAAVKQLLGIGDCDPVIRSVTARAAAELPAEASDMMLFGRGIEDGDPVALSALPHIVGAVAVRLDDHAETPLAPWVALAAAISRNPEPVAVILRVMIFHLVSRAKEPTIRAELGTAARALLNYSLTLPDPRGLTAAAITFVCETMASNVDASVALLDRLLTDARFDAFGPEEYPALARKIDVIYPLAPAFAVKIYADVYAREIREDRATRMGDSQILRLTSNAKQDFEMARWTLNEHYPSFLASLPVEGTAALLAALDGYLARDKRSKGGLPEFTVTLPAGDTVTVREDRSYVWAHEERPGSTQDADALLAGFLTFLKTGDEQGMLAAARYALRHASLGAVWSRLFLAAAARGGPLSDLVGLYAFQFGFLVGSDTRKGAVDVVASRYDRLSKGERVAFENQAAEANFEAFAFPVEAKQRLLSRLFATIGSDRLATRAAKKVVATTSASAETNPPLFSVTTETLPGDAYYWMNDTTRSAPDVLALTEAVDCVRKKLRLAPNDDDPLALSIDEALQTLRHLKEQIDAGRVSDETLMRQADGFFAEGVQKLVRSDLVGPDTEPDHVGLLADWIEMACTSTNPQTYPDTEAKFEKFTSWGSPSARLSGAEAALDLIWKRPETRPRLMPTADRMLADPHPAIRMHAADRLVRIWDLDREGFWQRAAQIVTSEQNRGVLNAFSTQTLGRLVGHGVAGEVAALVLPLLDRLDVKDERNDEIRRHLVQLTILLWQNFRIDEAAVRVRAWVAAPTDHVDEVCEIIKWLRADYVSGLRGPVDPQRPDRRAIASGVMSEAVEGATDELASHHDDFGDLAPVPLKRAQNAVQIVNEACQQMFFASGAFRQANQDESQPPMSVEDARTFFRETRATLERIAQHGETNTLYYLLQILEFLVDVHPSGVFDLVARTIRRGQRGGLAFEGLAADIAVNLVARYLADHREVFDDPDRRAALIDALEIFSTAGWPAALRLFYRLPELLE